MQVKSTNRPGIATLTNDQCRRAFDPAGFRAHSAAASSGRRPGQREEGDPNDRRRRVAVDELLGRTRPHDSARKAPVVPVAATAADVEPGKARRSRFRPFMGGVVVVDQVTEVTFKQPLTETVGRPEQRHRRRIAAPPGALRGERLGS